MNKQLFVSLSVSVLLLFSCSGEKKEDAVVQSDNERQIVAGKIPGAEGKTIKLMAFDGQRWNPLSAYEIDREGTFHLTAPKELLYCQLVVDNTNGTPVPLGGNDSVYIETGYPNMSTNYSVSNIPYASVMNEYMELLSTFLKEQEPLIQKIQQQDPSDTSSINGLMRQLMKEKRSLEIFAIEYINENPASPLNQVLTAQLFPNNGFQFWEKSNMEVLKKVHSSYKKEYPDASFTTSLQQQITSWEGSLVQYEKYQERLAFYGDLNKPVEIGDTAPDILLDTPNGEELRLSSLRGNYVLIDFWASWCGPCRRENPNVVRLYHQYKDKGFTVYSVSLDDNASNWKDAIQKDGLVWPNHVSDLMRWNSLVVQLYKFNGIPHTVLLDKNGVILAKNLRGAELEQKLIELLGK